MKPLAAAILLTLLSARPVLAAEVLVSASSWNVTGQDIALRLIFPKSAAQLLTQPGKPVPATEAVARYVLQRVHVEQDHVSCPTVDQGYDLGHIDPLFVGPGLFGFDILFHCPRPAGLLTLHNDALFDLPVTRIDAARIRLGSSSMSRLLSGERTLRIANGRLPAGSSAGTVFGLGWQHVLSSLVHLCTICGLFLCVRRRKELTFLALGVLAGYLLAALAATGWVIQPAPARAWDGFLVLLTAALLMGRTGEHRKPALGLGLAAGSAAAVAALRGQGDVALTLLGAGTFGFCLLWRAPWSHPAAWAVPAVALAGVDGFSLSSDLAPLGSAVSMHTPDILAFNIGAIAAVLTLFAATAAARRLLQRASFMKTAVLGDLLTASLAAVGAFHVLAV